MSTRRPSRPALPTRRSTTPGDSSPTTSPAPAGDHADGSDNTAGYRLTWDSQHLYLGAAVTDSIRRTAVGSNVGLDVADNDSDNPERP
jgi:hypothetical protein